MVDLYHIKVLFILGLNSRKRSLIYVYQVSLSAVSIKSSNFRHAVNLKPVGITL